MQKFKTETDVVDFVKRSEDMMRALRVARELNLPNWWVGAGFLRNRLWDEMSGVTGWDATDVDLVYYDPNDVTAETDWQYDDLLRERDPENNWEVRNQARMHYKNGFEPFTSVEDGIAHWTETATAIGVRLEDDERVRLLFCYGPDDLLEMIARPTPYLKGERMAIFHDRIEKKKWQERWPKLKVVTD